MVKIPVVEDDFEYKLERLWEWACYLQLNNNLHNQPRPFIRLLDLEDMADLMAEHLQIKSVAVRAKLRQTAMNRLRQLLNMEFLLLCDVCGKPHNQDEITAPER